MNIGQRIIELRQNLNLSSRKVALSVGISPGYLSDIERGLKTPTFEMLEKICIVLGITLKEFFDDAQQPFMLPEHFKDFFESNKDLTPEQLEQLTKFLKTLK